jgi:hypothetical protein
MGVGESFTSLAGGCFFWLFSIQALAVLGDLYPGL